MGHAAVLRCPVLFNIKARAGASAATRTVTSIERPISPPPIATVHSPMAPISMSESIVAFNASRFTAPQIVRAVRASHISSVANRVTVTFGVALQPGAAHGTTSVALMGQSLQFIDVYDGDAVSVL